MNCVFWSIGVVSLQGMGTSFRCPPVLLNCYLCPRTELLPMCLDCTDTMAMTPCPSCAAADAPRAHRGAGRATAQTLWPCEHPRQPYESWWSLRRATCQWIADRFFRAPGPQRLPLADGTSQFTD